MLNYTELEEIIDKFREELTLANRSGEEELENFLSNHNIEFSKEEQSFPYCDINSSQILVVGQLNVKKKDVEGICKDIGLDPDRLVYISYDDATNYHFDNLRFSNRYSDIIFGSVPHKGSGIGDSSSIITYLEKNKEEFPNVIRAKNSNGLLDLNKTSLRNCLMKTRMFEEIIN